LLEVRPSVLLVLILIVKGGHPNIKQFSGMFICRDSVPMTAVILHKSETLLSRHLFPP
jgi:hypothetical protein